MGDLTPEATVAGLAAEVDQLRASVRDHLCGRDETTRQTFLVIGASAGFGIVALGLAVWALARSGVIRDAARVLDSLAAR